MDVQKSSASFTGHKYKRRRFMCVKVHRENYFEVGLIDHLIKL